MPAKNDEMKEAWMPIKGYEGLYEISNFGNVKRCSRKIYHDKLLGDKEFYILPEILLRHNILKGYHYAHLKKDGTSKGFRIHRLVALHFIGEPPGPEYQINHIDGNKANNRADNLEWVTPRQNTHHAIDSGVRQYTEARRAKQKEASRKLWQSEDYRRKQSEQQKASWAKNKAERSLAIKEGIRRAKNGRKEIQQEIQ